MDLGHRSRLVRIDLDERTLDRLTEKSRLVLKTFPESPAHERGIRVGWRLLTVDGKSPSDDVVQETELGGPANLVFAAPGPGEIYALDRSLWPFGMVTVPWPGRSLARRIAWGACDTEDLSRFWKEGMLTPCAGFAEPLERLMSKGLFTRFGGKVSAPSVIAASDDYTAMGLLALAKAVAGDFDAAQFYVAATRESRRRANQATHSTIQQSLEYYVESVIAEHRGDRPEALRLALAAKQQGQHIWSVELLLARLQDRPPELAEPAWTLETFPLDYRLPAHDPVGEIKNNVDFVDLGGALAGLTDDQVVVVFVMGGYRSNYYYNLDLERLAVLNRAFPGFVREVHVVVSDTYALSAGHRRHSEAIAKRLHLPFAILWDKENAVAEALKCSGFPERFILDREARIVATERLMEEDGFWKAAARLRDLKHRPQSAARR